MMWEFFITALLSTILMGYVVFRQFKEVLTDGELLPLKVVLFIMGMTIFLTSFIAVYFHLSRTGVVPQIFDPTDINRMYSIGRLIKVIILFIIYWQLTKERKNELQ